jgi:hypothetical protein
VTNQQILAIQSYILACVKHEAAHYHDKSEALMAMVRAQNRMHELLIDPLAAEKGDTDERA